VHLREALLTEFTIVGSHEPSQTTDCELQENDQVHVNWVTHVNDVKRLFRELGLDELKARFKTGWATYINEIYKRISHAVQFGDS